MLPVKGTWVRSLVGELGSHMTCRIGKKKTKQKTTPLSQYILFLGLWVTSFLETLPSTNLSIQFSLNLLLGKFKKKKSTVESCKWHGSFPAGVWQFLGPKMGLPGGSDTKESACNAGDPGSIPGSGRSPGGGNGNPLLYSRLENPMDRGVWRVTVHGVTRVGHDWEANTFTFCRMCFPVTRYQQEKWNVNCPFILKKLLLYNYEMIIPLTLLSGRTILIHSIAVHQ